jgi:hypothetical protein
VTDTKSSHSPAVGDIIALVASIVILVGFAVFPLRVDSGTTGLAFIDSSTTFPDLTLIVGAVGLVTSCVSLAVIRDQGVRWWFLGLGLLGLVYPLDNVLREKPGFALGGLLATIGCAALVLQAILPRGGEKTHQWGNTVLGLVRVLLGTLWFTQLLWKLPWDNYGCPAGSLVPAANTSGLCDWIGREIASPRWPIYKTFLQNVVAPNLSWLALLIVAGEAFMAFTLLFGLFTRLGALAAFGQGINLFIGLSVVPGEWEWSYLMLTALCLVFIIFGGNWVGIDAVLYTQFKKMNNPIGRLLTWLVS